ncbi:hypothetical protein DYB32_010825, partial [Aphanomyces invadans]
QAAETIGQLRSDLAVVNNKVDAWSKRFQTVGSVEASLRASIAPLKAQREAQGWQAASLQLDLDRAYLILAEMARLENEVKRFKEAPSAASSPRLPSVLAPVTEHVLRARVRELEGELAAARSSAETSRTTVESLLDALRARAKDQEEVLNKSAEVVGTLRDSNLALGQECDELRVRLDVAEQDALKANRRFADAVPIFWDWVVRQFAVEKAELVPSLVASWKAGVSDAFAQQGKTQAIAPAPAMLVPPAPFVGRIVGRDNRFWAAARLQPSGSDDTESPPDTPPSSPAIKRSSDGSGPGKAEKARKTPPAPCGVQGLAHDDLPPSVVIAYEEVIAARPWGCFHTQVSFVPKAFRADAEWKALHQSLVDFWSGHARAIWNRWFQPLSSPAADAEVDRAPSRHGDDILRFLSYPHSFWPVYLSQGIMLRSVVRRHGEAEAIRYLREGGTQWWPEVPTLVKSRFWRAPDNATLAYLHKRKLKPGTAAKFDLNRSGVTQDVVRRSIASMLDVINGARYGTGPPKPFPFLVASYSEPPIGSQCSSTITLQRGTPYVETTSSAAPSQSSGAVESQAPSSSTPRPVHVSSDGSISL